MTFWAVTASSVPVGYQRFGGLDASIFRVRLVGFEVDTDLGYLIQEKGQALEASRKLDDTYSKA
jgi:hypothetical protein